MANRKSMPLLTELEELNGRSFSINISLLAELADILCSVSFGQIGTVLETQAGYRVLLNWCTIWVISFRKLGEGTVTRMGRGQ
jgi:hypothetical protein